MTTANTILEVPPDLDVLLDETIPDYDSEFASRRAAAGIYRRYLAGVQSICQRADLPYDLSPWRRIDANGYVDHDYVADAQIGDLDDDEPTTSQISGRRVRADMPVGLHVTNRGRPEESLLYEFSKRRRRDLPPYGTITVYSVSSPGESTTFALREREWRLINRRVLREIAANAIADWWRHWWRQNADNA